MITEWITAAARETAVTMRRLSKNEVDYTVGLIVSRFTRSMPGPHRLWEAFVGETSRRRSDGWHKLCDFGEGESILLYQDPVELQGVVFSSPRVLRLVLSEAPRFEVYVTNSAADFVLCHNHHDFLIGVGSCADWLSNISDDD